MATDTAEGILPIQGTNTNIVLESMWRKRMPKKRRNMCFKMACSRLSDDGNSA